MSERQKLERAVDAFAAAMKARLMTKLKQGWGGWDEGRWQESIAERMLLNAARAKEHRDEKSLIDTANLAMMLWRKP